MGKDSKSNETVEATKETKTATVINTNNKNNVQSSPIVIKIEAPKDAIKQQVMDEIKNHIENDNEKSTRSRCCQYFPIILFLVTFATVLSLLICYMDPSSEYQVFLD